MICQINAHGMPFIILGLFISILCYICSYYTNYWLYLNTLYVVTCAGILFSIFCAYFFRDPERIAPFSDKGDDIIISPADGTITSIEDCASLPDDIYAYTDNIQYKRISIFLNIFNVHVNRAPYAGKIEAIKYIPGKFFNATLDKSSQHNERQIFHIKGKHDVFCTQIAGLIARRIVRFVHANDTVKAGDRIGLIKFGSRMDVYVPSCFACNLRKHDKVKAGETILFTLKRDDI
jgi:phosphatidylserine decarboxylase